MASRLSIAAFLEVLRRSGLLSSERLEELHPESDQQTTEEFADSLVHANVLTAWQAAKLLQGRHKGMILGKYRLLNLLGRGGMSHVYLAEHQVMKRQVAIKVLPAKSVNDQSAFRRFILEAQAVGSLDHPNIVRAYDIDEVAPSPDDPAVHFIVMEYVRGQNLKELVESERRQQADFCGIDQIRAADYLRQAAEGVQHAHEHENRLVHRDIKPGNLLLDDRGVVKLLDLGLARLLVDAEENSSVTRDHSQRILGTADYLSPEQAVDSHEVDWRADIYSLGCTGCYLLTGEPPFPKGTLAQRLMAHQTQPPPNLIERRPDLDPDLAKIIYKALEKSKSDRYQSAREFVTALEDWLADRSVPGIKKAEPAARTADSPDSNLPDAIRQLAQFDSLHEDSGSENFPDLSKTPEDPDLPEPAIPDFSELESTDLDSTGSGNATARRNSASDDEATQHLPEIEPAVASPVERASAEAGRRSEQAMVNSLSSLDSISEFQISTASTIRESSALDTLRVRSPFRLSRNSPRWLPVAAGAVLMMLVAGLWFAFRGGSGSSTNGNGEQVGTEAGLKPVMTVGDGGDFSTLQEALDFVHKEFAETEWDEQVVELLPGEHKASISLANDLLDPFPINVVLRGKPGSILKADNGKPVFDLLDIEGLTMRDFDIDADGSPIAVRLAGRMIGTRLNDLKISGFSEAGILLDEVTCYRNDDRELLLDHLVIDGAPEATGIHSVPQSNLECFTTIERCFFTGTMKTGVELGDYASEVRIRGCVFWELDRGVAFSGADPVITALTLSQNTFSRCAVGVEFSQQPSSYSGKFRVMLNLFVGNREADFMVREGFDSAGLRKIFVPSAGLANNVSTRASVDRGQFNLFQNGRSGIADPQWKSETPGDVDFAVPVKTAELKRGNSEAGAHAFIGRE